MQVSYIAAAALLALFAAGCSGKNDPVPSAQVSAGAPAAGATSARRVATKETLMRAVVGKQYRAATGDVLAELPMFEDRKKNRLYVVAPSATSVLATGETVLVAKSTYAEENEEKIEQPDFFNIYYAVYVLREVAGQWTVARRYPNIAYRGFDECRGSVIFPELGKDIPGLALASGDNDHGCFSNAIHLFDLRDESLRDLTGTGIPTGSSTNENCGGTDLQPDEETNATWHLAAPKKPSAYSDIAMTFVTETTFMSSAEEDATKSIVKKKDRARYAYDGKRYKLADGDSPLDSVDRNGKPHVSAENAIAKDASATPAQSVP